MQTRSIPLLNAGSLCDTHWLIFYTVRKDEWHVTTIEIYGDAEHTKLLADDVSLADLDPRAEMMIVRALNREYENQQLLELACRRLVLGAA